MIFTSLSSCIFTTVGSLSRGPVQMLPPVVIRPMSRFLRRFLHGDRMLSFLRTLPDVEELVQWRLRQAVHSTYLSLDEIARAHLQEVQSQRSLSSLRYELIHCLLYRAPFTHFCMFSPGPLLTTLIIPPSEHQGCSVRTTLTVPFPLTTVRLQLLLSHPQSQIHL